uniref:Uncharacterized protein n=1 Tax=Polytomella parva TaxID=51329 RepID=A0A7S0VFE4_9CHLO|mmetsp:Transcript_34765/g.62565  ORF Transcript_34765/g.62565 Transcript_34765/m.62565 type:complete len:159 (+) Transcript_34765:183-659(+)
MDAALALKQRVWKQKAQHNIRVLLTALKAFKSKYEDFSANAEKTLSEVSNNILLEHTILPSLQFPSKAGDLLAPLIPAKLYLKMKTMCCLKDIKEDIAILYMDLNAVRNLLQEAYCHFSPDINWHVFMPIFTSMHYPKILDLFFSNRGHVEQGFRFKI